MRSNLRFAALVLALFVFVPACLGDLAGCLGCSEDELGDVGGLTDLFEP